VTNVVSYILYYKYYTNIKLGMLVECYVGAYAYACHHAWFQNLNFKFAKIRTKICRWMIRRSKLPLQLMET